MLILGDSGVWGWLLENEDTLAGQINEQMLHTEDGRRVVAYNLGYPIMSLTKDLMLLDAALEYDPDLILWPVTLASFSRPEQLEHPLLQNNPDRVGRLSRIMTWIWIPKTRALYFQLYRKHHRWPTAAAGRPNTSAKLRLFLGRHRLLTRPSLRR